MEQLYFHIGMNEDFKLKLSAKDNSPAYSQSLSTPINLKKDIFVELYSFQICESHFRSKNTQRQTTTFGRPPKDQYYDIW